MPFGKGSTADKRLLWQPWSLLAYQTRNRVINVQFWWNIKQTTQPIGCIKRFRNIEFEIAIFIDIVDLRESKLIHLRNTWTSNVKLKFINGKWANHLRIS